MLQMIHWEHSRLHVPALHETGFLCMGAKVLVFIERREISAIKKT
jgi:hypothetical protein